MLETTSVISIRVIDLIHIIHERISNNVNECNWGRKITYYQIFLLKSFLLALLIAILIELACKLLEDLASSIHGFSQKKNHMWISQNHSRGSQRKGGGWGRRLVREDKAMGPFTNGLVCNVQKNWSFLLKTSRRYKTNPLIQVMWFGDLNLNILWQ
jgi:hypothetical protein